MGEAEKPLKGELRILNFKQKKFRLTKTKAGGALHRLFLCGSRAGGRLRRTRRYGERTPVRMHVGITLS